MYKVYNIILLGLSSKFVTVSFCLKVSFDEHVSNFDKFKYIIFFFYDYCFLYTKNIFAYCMIAKIILMLPSRNFIVLPLIFRFSMQVRLIF